MKWESLATLKAGGWPVKVDAPLLQICGMLKSALAL